MKGQLAFEAIGALSDDLILESAEALGFMENSPAAAPRHRRESTLSRFFGSGWGVAMICAVVSLSVLGGIVWAGQRPVAGPQDTTTESETETETETETLPEFEEGTDPTAYYFQTPLTDHDDTLSYASVSDWDDEGVKHLSFYVRPQNTEDGKLTLVLGFGVTTTPQFPVNLQVVSYRSSDGTFGILIMREYVFAMPDNDKRLYVAMECYRLGVYTSKYVDPYTSKLSYGAGGCGTFACTEEGKLSDPRDYQRNIILLNHATNYIERYNNNEGYEYTVMYSYIDGVEVINTPVDSIPEFPYSIIRRYNVDPSQSTETETEAETESSTPSEEDPYVAMQNELRSAIMIASSGYITPNGHSGLLLPTLLAGVEQGHDDYTMALGVSSVNVRDVVLLFDHDKAQVTLTLHEDGSMTIVAKSGGNFECKETVMPGEAISDDIVFGDANSWYSDKEPAYAPRYLLLYAMHHLEAFMGELDSRFSFEALGFTYGDYENYPDRVS